MIKLFSFKLSQGCRTAKDATPFLLAALSFVCCLLPLNACLGDTVYLKGSERAVLLKVDKVTEKYIIATIQKPLVNNINIIPDNSKMFPDVIYFGNNPQNKIKCKIIDITNNVYIIKLPMSGIALLEMDTENKSGENIISLKEKELSNMLSQSPKPHEDNLLDLELLEEMESDTANTKEQITNSTGRESNALIREPWPGYDMNNSSSLKMEDSSSAIDPDRLKEEIKKELMDAMNKQKEDDEERFLLENTGKVTGTIFRNGKPLPDCKVQIVALTEERFLLSKQIKRGKQLETATDEHGKYYFENVSPGSYKLFWKPSYATSWIRRLDMKPDIIVTAGKTTFPKTIEIGKRVLN